MGNVVILLALTLGAGACCRSQIVDYPVLLDGGIEDGFSDAACAQICLAHYASFDSCAIKPATASTPEHIACYGHAICE